MGPIEVITSVQRRHRWNAIAVMDAKYHYDGARPNLQFSR